MPSEKISIESAREIWKEYERQTYPVAMSDPVRYERMHLIIRNMVDSIQHIDSSQELLSAWPTAQDRLSTMASKFNLSLGNMPRLQVSGAAFALRDREIQLQDEIRDRQARIDKARNSNQSWVVLEEAGQIEAGLLNPYRRSEMHIASGLTITTFVQADPCDGKPLFVVSVIKLDPRTSELLDPKPGIEDWKEYTDSKDFSARVASLRRSISQYPATV